MIATGKRTIKNGTKYVHLFDRPKGKNILKKKDAGVSDTVSLMQWVIRKTRLDTLKISKVLQRSSVRETCKAIWEFCFNHFQYTKDETGIEQVRRPSRSWADRAKGIDCDCFTVFIGSILSNLNIPYVIRLTKYTSSQFEHVYPVATPKQEQEIIIDCVVHEFDYEVNYTEKKDIKMELEYLNGVPEDQYDEYDELVRYDNDLPIDAEDLFFDEFDLDGLEGRAERLARKAKRKTKRTERKTARKKKNAEIKQLPKKERIKARLRQGLNIINKVNPATALLRAGVLASMKLNLFKVASKLRFAYWTDAQALRNNMDMRKFQNLKRIMGKIQKVYYGAGGNPEKLKKAILIGKGNRNRMVGLNGLGSVEIYHDEDDLDLILGAELMDEIGEAGLSGLGSVTTAAAVASASGLIGTIAALLKKLGVLFKKGTPQADQETIQDNTDDQEEKNRKFSFKNLRSTVERFASKVGRGGSRSLTENNALTTKSNAEDDFQAENFETENFDVDTDFTKGADDDTNKNADDSKGLGKWIKENPGMAAAAGVGGAAVIGGVIYAIVRNNKKKNQSKSKSPKTMNGVAKRKTSKKGKSLRKRTNKKSKPSRTRARKTGTTRKVRAINLT